MCCCSLDMRSSCLCMQTPNPGLSYILWYSLLPKPSAKTASSISHFPNLCLCYASQQKFFCKERQFVFSRPLDLFSQYNINHGWIPGSGYLATVLEFALRYTVKCSFFYSYQPRNCSLISKGQMRSRSWGLNYEVRWTDGVYLLNCPEAWREVVPVKMITVLPMREELGLWTWKMCLNPLWSLVGTSSHHPIAQRLCSCNQSFLTYVHPCLTLLVSYTT